MIDDVVKYQYDYDENGNILVETVDNVDIVSSYDHQDRLINKGDKEYIFTDRGSLLKVIENGSETIFDYDVFGNLLEIFCLAASPKRRLRSPRVGWAAFLNQNGEIESYFIYGTRSNVPEYMIKDGKKYKFIVDHLGSVRKVIDLYTKEVVQEIKYTPYGKILSDTNVQLLHPNADCDRLELDGQLFPNFQPFGYVGGIYDQDSGLIRYGARDYDPETHRWTSKEPLGFAGSMNFYGYCEGDPVNFVDVTGLKKKIVWVKEYHFGKGQRFKTQEEAMDFAVVKHLQDIMCDSIRHGLEDGFVIEKKLSLTHGKLSIIYGKYTDKRTYRSVGFSTNSKTIGTAHTHIYCGEANKINNANIRTALSKNEVNYEQEFNPDSFSDADMNTNVGISYIATITGYVRKWNPSIYNNSVIAKNKGYNGGEIIGKLHLDDCKCEINNNLVSSNPLCR